VAAILDHGSDEAFAVHMEPAESEQTRIAHKVYSVTEFS
jgi:hypothetical protein